MGGVGGSVMVRVTRIYHTGTAMARHVHLALVLVAARDVHFTVRRGMRIGSVGVDSGNSYHDAPVYPAHHAPAPYPARHAPAYPAPVRHHEAYDPHRPNTHASGDVNVSGNYKQEGEVHVSGSGASRVVAAGNSYHDTPVHHAPAYPAHPAPAYPAHPAPAYPAHPAPAHDNVHVSGAAGAARVVESGNAYQDSPVHRAAP